MGSLQVQRFSTDQSAPDARLDYWNALASETFNSLTVDSLDGRFRGEMIRAPLGEFALMSARSAPAEVTRTNDLIRAKGLRAFDLHFQLEGRSLNAQAGREASLEAGDFTLCDASQPYRVRFNEANHMLCLKIPAEALAARLGDLESLICVPMAARRGGAAVLSAFLRSVWTEIQAGGAEEDWAETVGGVLFELLALSYQPLKGESRPGSARAARLKEAQELIEERLCEPGFGAGAVAEALGVTARYVQLLFAQARTTPSAYILERRLEQAALRLRGGVGRGGVTEAALAVGFNDITHFGRSFRRRFGVSPSDYAQGSRAAPWAAEPVTDPLGA